MTRTFIMNEEVRNLIERCNRQMDLVKPFITKENATYYDAEGAINLIWLCGAPRYNKDDPELVQHFADLGAPVILPNTGKSFYSTCLSVTAIWEKPKTLRKILDLGHPVNAENSCGETALDQLVSLYHGRISALILLDAGGRCVKTEMPRWLKTFQTFRESVRSSAISTMGALQRRKRVGKDVARIIGRSIWALRGIYKEDE